MHNIDIEILDWLLTHRTFTYKELLNYMLSKGCDEDMAKNKMYNILESSQIKRSGAYYIFVTHL